MKRHLAGLTRAGALGAATFGALAGLDRAGIPAPVAYLCMTAAVLVVTFTPVVRAVLPAVRARHQLVEVTEDGLRTTRRRRVRTMRWGDVVSVRMRTTDMGPQLDDVFLELADAGGWVSIGSEHPAHHEVLQAVRRNLPDVDMGAVLPASWSVENAIFPMWSRT